MIDFMAVGGIIFFAVKIYTDVIKFDLVAASRLVFQHGEYGESTCQINKITIVQV